MPRACTLAASSRSASHDYVARDNDVAHAQCGNVRQLRFAWLAGRGYPVIETMPVIDGLGIDHHRNISGLRGDPKTVFCTVARFGFVQNSNRPQRMPIALPPEEEPDG